MGVLENTVDKDGNGKFIMVDGENRKKIVLPLADVEAIFKGLRPRNMEYHIFKKIRRLLQDEVRKHLDGEMVHLSKVSDEAWQEYKEKMRIRKSAMQKGKTYVRGEEQDS